MALREFLDDDGRSWQVWEVQPQWLERRNADDAQAIGDAVERRKQESGDARLRTVSELANGWLAFECRGECRRLHPYPQGWDSLQMNELRDLLNLAKPARKRRRLIE